MQYEDLSRGEIDTHSGTSGPNDPVTTGGPTALRWLTTTVMVDHEMHTLCKWPNPVLVGDLASQSVWNKRSFYIFKWTAGQPMNPASREVESSGSNFIYNLPIPIKQLYDVF